jgi:hypothetical protein
LESSGLDWLSSADAKLETAAMQPARNEIDLMMGSSQVTQSHVRFWMEIKVAWWCCWNVAHTRLLHSCSLRRSRWGTSVLGIAMQLKLHPTRPPRSYPHTTHGASIQRSQQTTAMPSAHWLGLRHCEASPDQQWLLPRL